MSESVAESGVGGPSSAASKAQNAAQLVPYNTQPEYDLVIPPTTGEFARKLYKLLEDPLPDFSVVCWAPTRDRFIIKDTDVFSKTVLPRIFHHSNFSSFVRQLNKYDFHKIKTSSPDNQAWTFQHRYFHKDKPQDLHHIQRKTTPSLASFDNGTARDRSPSFNISEYPNGSRADSELKSDVERLMIENEKLRTRVMELERTNGAMSLNLQSVENRAFLQGEKIVIVRQLLAERDASTVSSISQPIFQPAEPLQYNQSSHSQVRLAPGSQAPLIIEDQRWSQQVGGLDPPVIASTTSLDSSSVQFEGPGQDLEHYLQAEQWNEVRDSNGQWGGDFQRPGVIPQIGIAGSTLPGRGAEQLYQEFGSDSEHLAGVGHTEQRQNDVIRRGP